jgi:hypothetical protein
MTRLAKRINVQNQGEESTDVSTSSEDTFTSFLEGMNTPLG